MQGISLRIALHIFCVSLGVFFLYFFFFFFLVEEGGEGGALLFSSFAQFVFSLCELGHADL